MKITNIRFPNESSYVGVENFKWDEFKVEHTYEKCMFGWYGDIYISVYEEDNK